MKNQGQDTETQIKTADQQPAEQENTSLIVEETVQGVVPAQASEVADVEVTPVTSGKKRKKRKERQPTEEELMPRPSFWPIVLATSIAVFLAGTIMSPIILGAGVVMVIVSILGWVLERR